MTVSTWQSKVMQEPFDQTRKVVHRFSSGECLYRQDRLLVLLLPPGRNTLVSSWMNGGYREDIRAIFNSQSHDGIHDLMKVENYTMYLRYLAERAGLDPEHTSGLGTAVHMDNAVVVTHRYNATEVTAIVTAGVEGNGGRAGDPASYNEVRGFEPVGGTIVTMLMVNGDLPKHTMARAIMTATEAKTCALQQLMAPSRYSTGIATGSGTDQIAVISNRDSSNRLTDAGKHSKLGELIGRTVTEATLQALDRHGGLNPLSQRDIMVRLKRYRISEKDIWKAAQSLPGTCGEQEFYEYLRALSKRPDAVAAVGSILHIQDEISWGLIPEDVGRRLGGSMIKELQRMLDLPGDDAFEIMIEDGGDLLSNLTEGLAQIAKYGW